MRRRVSLVRVGVALVVGLLLLGFTYSILTGSLANSFSVARGFAGASWDLSRGRWVLHVPARFPRGRFAASPWLEMAGLQYRVEYYRCFGSAPCSTYYETYDAQVRKAINHHFGYDVFAEGLRHSNITVVIKHE